MVTFRAFPISLPQARCLPAHRLECVCNRSGRCESSSWCLLLALIIIGLCGLSNADASPLELRLRIAWGGGSPRTWQGTIGVESPSPDSAELPPPGSLPREAPAAPSSLTDASRSITFAEPRWLGSDINAVSRVIVTDRQIRLSAEGASRYRALDVTVRGEPTDWLVWNVVSPPETVPSVHRVTLAQLVSQSFTQSLDASGNRLHIQRVPGDMLRIRSLSDHLVFSPRQTWSIEVVPHLVPESEGGRLQIRMVRSRGGTTIWKTERTLNVSYEGTFPAIRDVQIPMPAEEGCYDLEMKWSGPRGRNLFRNAGESIERKIQFVVVDPRQSRVPMGQPAWREITSFDASQPQWWERLTPFPQWERLPLPAHHVRGEGTARVEKESSQSASVLDPGGWQSYPLPIERPATPHVLEVECLGGNDQVLGISIVEQSASEPDRSESVDWVMQSQSNEWGGKPGSRRILFWPRTKTPSILLTNLHASEKARYGRIRLLAGPARLPQTTAGITSRRGFRKAFMQLDDAHLTRTFNVALGLDASSKRYLHDWQAHYDAGNRMVDYLRYGGLDGVCLPCLAEGGSLTGPLPVGANARFDTGAYFADGCDAMPKDVVEMLMRMFDRDGLQLMLSVRWNAPIQELEQQKQDGMDSVGIELVDVGGKRQRDHEATSQADRKPYNILDRRVQSAMVTSVRKLIDRYGHHPSFAGISLDLRSDTSTHLPGLKWGYDSRTIAAFRREMASEIAGIEGVVPTGDWTPSDVLGEALFSTWLRWRAARVTEFHRRIAEQLQEVRPDTRLVLATTGLAGEEVVQSACHPRLPATESVPQALYQLGLDMRQLSPISGVTITKPVPCLGRLNEVGEASRLAFSAETVWMDTESTDGPRTSELIDPIVVRTLAPATLRWMGRAVDDATVEPRPIHDAMTIRRRLATVLRAQDCETLLWGGSMLAMVDSPDAREWLSQFRQLPSGPYAEFKPASAHPVIVRSRTHAGKTYVYAWNDSPWPVTTHVTWSAPVDCQFESLRFETPGDPLSGVTSDVRRDQWTSFSTSPIWSARLEPYEMVAAVLSDEHAEVLHVQSDLDGDIQGQMQARLAETADRLPALKTPLPFHRLTDAGFDAEGDAAEIPGWQSSQAADVSIQRDFSIRHSGVASLRMESRQGVAWVRSDPLPEPGTGRLSVQAMFRFDENASRRRTLPPIRLALEGTYRDRTYYRFAQISVATLDEPESREVREPWVPFMLHVADLPTSELKDLRVRFDLMGEGRVWIDDVRLFRLAFSPEEQLELSKIVGLADFELREGRPANCARILDGFWPRYVLRNVPPPATQLVSSPELPAADLDSGPIPSNEVSASPSDVPSRTSVLDRVRDMLPKF